MLAYIDACRLFVTRKKPALLMQDCCKCVSDSSKSPLTPGTNKRCIFIQLRGGRWGLGTQGRGPPGHWGSGTATGFRSLTIIEIDTTLLSWLASNSFASVIVSTPVFLPLCIN